MWAKFLWESKQLLAIYVNDNKKAPFKTYDFEWGSFYLN